MAQHGNTTCYSIKKFVRRDIYEKSSTSEGQASYPLFVCNEVDNVVTSQHDFVESGWMCMTFGEYDKYLRVRQRLLEECRRNYWLGKEAGVTNTDNQNSTSSSPFTSAPYTVKLKNGITFDARHVVLYLVDLNLMRYMPEAYRDLVDNFPLKECLPGQQKCLHRFLAPESRPFLGPNLYITPPGASTYFHQDGHGTVDSGHLCLSGDNEVIMLPRLGRDRTKEALEILRGDQNYDLLEEPHSDKTFAKKPMWPSPATLKKLKRAGISYTQLTLSAGEFLHINKGRLHMFRKATQSTSNIGNALPELQDICVSVAWDWVYEGYSKDGVAREAAQMLAAADANRDGTGGKTVPSLGIPATAITAATKALVAKVFHNSASALSRHASRKKFGRRHANGLAMGQGTSDH